MKKLWQIIGVLIKIIGIPGAALSFISFLIGYPFWGKLYSATTALIIAIMAIVALSHKKSSPLLYFINRYFGKCSYIIEQQTVTFDFTDTEAKYTVDITYKSLVNFTIGVLQTYKERTYATANAKRNIIFETIAEPYQHNIYSSWVDSGWVYFFAIPDKHLQEGETARFRHHMFVKNPQRINGSLVREIPIKKLTIKVILPSHEQPVKARWTVTDPENPHRKIIDKPILNEHLNIEISYPVKGYRYALEWQ